MGDDILEALEWKNGKIYDDSDSSCGKDHEMDGYNLSMSDRIEENPIDKLYIWLSNTINGERDIVEGNTIFYLSENGWDRRVIQSKTKMTRI